MSTFLHRQALALSFPRVYPGHVLFRYEDLVDAKLDALETYLGFELRGAAVVDEPMSYVARTLSYGDWRHWFTPADLEVLRPLLVPLLVAYGYDDDWGLAHEPVINREHASGYIVRAARRLEQTRRNAQPRRRTLRRAKRLLGRAVRRVGAERATR